MGADGWLAVGGLAFGGLAVGRLTVGGGGWRLASCGWQFAAAGKLRLAAGSWPLAPASSAPHEAAAPRLSLARDGRKSARRAAAQLRRAPSAPEPLARRRRRRKKGPRAGRCGWCAGSGTGGHRRPQAATGARGGLRGAFAGPSRGPSRAAPGAACSLAATAVGLPTALQRACPAPWRRGIERYWPPGRCRCRDASTESACRHAGPPLNRCTRRLPLPRGSFFARASSLRAPRPPRPSSPRPPRLPSFVLLPAILTTRPPSRRAALRLVSPASHPPSTRQSRCWQSEPSPVLSPARPCAPPPAPPPPGRSLYGLNPLARPLLRPPASG